MRIFRRSLVDRENSNSLINKVRAKRMTYLKALIESIEDPNGRRIKILDVGGEPIFWKNSNLDFSRYDITLMNLKQGEPISESMECIIGDARDLSRFEDMSFDLVVSNSVIEHVGTFQDQTEMANHIRRVGKRIFLQTPNYWFPVETHFVTPFFQYLPIWMRTWMVCNFNLGNYKKTKDWEIAKAHVTQIELLSKRQCRFLFPDSTIENEWLFGMVNGFIITQGWPTEVVGYRRH
jgi:SAM-dependent methyltransferase